MSFADTKGSTLLITPGSQSRRASATSRLLVPDQLMKIFTGSSLWSIRSRRDAPKTFQTRADSSQLLTKGEARNTRSANGVPGRLDLVDPWQRRLIL